ncbi:MAG TPA: ethanolamine ammonia-lyase subunit EutB, partial [Leptospiraceae bacterium]|nr:ethanolamine ammonia-lyase subunit EutB [Leptospiraceae bacterium]
MIWAVTGATGFLGRHLVEASLSRGATVRALSRTIVPPSVEHFEGDLLEPDPAGIAASIVDGLLYGSGDAVIGINPATDSPAAVRTLLELIDAVRQRYDAPVQSCVLAHITTQLQALE